MAMSDYFDWKPENSNIICPSSRRIEITDVKIFLTIRHDCADTVCYTDGGKLFTVKSLGEDQNWDAEEDEEVDYLLAVVLNVVSEVFEEDRPPRGQLDTWFSGGAKRAVTQLRTAHSNNSVSSLNDVWDDMSSPYCSVPASANVCCAYSVSK